MDEDEMREQIRESLEEGYSRQEIVASLKSLGMTADKVKLLIGTSDSTPGSNFEVKKVHIIAIIVLVIAVVLILSGAGIMLLASIFAGG